MEEAPTTGALEAMYPEEDQGADEDAEADDAENQQDEDDEDDTNVHNDAGEDGEVHVEFQSAHSIAVAAAE